MTNIPNQFLNMNPALGLNTMPSLYPNNQLDSNVLNNLLNYCNINMANGFPNMNQNFFNNSNSFYLQNQIPQNNPSIYLNNIYSTQQQQTNVNNNLTLNQLNQLNGQLSNLMSIPFCSNNINNLAQFMMNKNNNSI